MRFCCKKLLLCKSEEFAMSSDNDGVIDDVSIFSRSLEVAPLGEPARDEGIDPRRKVGGGSLGPGTCRHPPLSLLRQLKSSRAAS
jgi:hypothetical protein